MRQACVSLLLLAALVVGVVNADGRSTATTTVTVNVLGVGTVKSSPAGINCGNGNKKCYIAYSGTGDTVTLTASPGGGWSDDIWGAGSADTDCVGSTDTPCTTITLDGTEHIATASFKKSSGTTQSTLNVTYDNGGDDGDVTSPDKTPPGHDIDCGSTGPTTLCSWTVLTGSTLTLFQTPDTGNIFTGWGGACSGTGEACTVQVNSDQHVNAAWAAASQTAQLTVNITGGGQVSGGGIKCPTKCVATEALNAAVTLSADAADGQIFTGWTGGCTGASPTCVVTMDSDTSVTATFVVANTLTVDLVGNGSVTGGAGAINCGFGANICSANFALNASVTLVASGAVGTTFTGWTGACGGITTTCTVSMNQSKSVTATFTGGTTPPPTTTFALTVSVSGNGTVTGGGISCGNGATTCSSSGHAVNSAVTLVATPVGGATFAGWGGGTCTGAITTCTVTFNAAKTVTATFTGGTSSFPLTVSVSGPGKVTGPGISCGNGASTCSANFTGGSTGTLTAAAASGAKFAGWGGACSGTAATCTVSMTAAKTVSATFTAAAIAGTLTINVGGRGAVSTPAGSCASTGAAKTCTQHFKAGAVVGLTAHPAAGQTFLGWSGACTGKKTTCSVKLTTAQTVSANFSNSGSPPPPSHVTLTSIGTPIVVKTKRGYNVTLRFATTVGGTARVTGVRAGRTVVSVSARVGAGRVRVGPFPVALGGLYTFKVRLAGAGLNQRACLGGCLRHAPPPTFVLTRAAPGVTRTGDVWSVTLHATANQIYDGRIRAYRGNRLLVGQHFLGHAGRVAFGPFLLGPGNYTLRLVGVDAYGRTRTLSWIVSLA